MFRRDLLKTFTALGLTGFIPEYVETEELRPDESGWVSVEYNWISYRGATLRRTITKERTEMYWYKSIEDYPRFEGILLHIEHCGNEQKDSLERDRSLEYMYTLIDQELWGI